MDGLLLDERRPRLVVGERIAATGGAHARDPVLQQRVALGVHEHQAADLPDGAHAGEELGVRDVRVRGVGDGHEGLEAHRALGPLAGDLGDRRRRQRAPEPEVDHDLASRHLALLAVQPGRRHGRIRERVLDHGRDAAGGGRHRAGREVLALGVPGILEMRVHVDRARQHDEPGGVDRFVRRAALAGPGEGRDALRPRSRHPLRRRRRPSPPCRPRSASALLPPPSDHATGLPPARVRSERVRIAAAIAMSSSVVSSSGRWLTPPLRLRTKSMPVSTPAAARMPAS